MISQRRTKLTLKCLSQYLVGDDRITSEEHDRSLGMWYMQDKVALLAYGDNAINGEKEWVAYWTFLIVEIDRAIVAPKANLSTKAIVLDAMAKAFEAAKAGKDPEKVMDAASAEDATAEGTEATTNATALIRLMMLMMMVIMTMLMMIMMLMMMAMTR